MASIPATGIRHLKVTIRDGSSPQKSRTLLCTAQSIPVPTQPAMVNVKVEGELVAILPGESVESTFKIGVLEDSFIDTTKPKLTEIILGTGAGADWTPINSTVAGLTEKAVAVENTYRVFEFVAEMAGVSMGGTTTYRLWRGTLTPPAEMTRADPNIIEYTGMVQGPIVDSTTAP